MFGNTLGRRLLTTFTLALSLTAITANLASAAQVTSGLLVDINVENPNSYSGSGNQLSDVAGATNSMATFVNSPTYVQDIESGIKLDGVNQYLSIPDAPELRIAYGNALTYLIWAKVESYTAGDALFSKEMGSGGWDGFDLSLRSSNSLRLFFNGGLAESTSSANNVFSLNTWTLFTAVLRFGGNSNLSRIYVNSTEVATLRSTDTNPGTTTASIAIGANYVGTSGYPAMTVGAFAVYNRELSSTEVATSYDYYANYFNDVSSITVRVNPNIQKGVATPITATVGARGKVRFFNNGKRIPGCVNVAVSMTSFPLQATCSFKPPTTGTLKLSAQLIPSTIGISSVSSWTSAQVATRGNTR